MFFLIFNCTQALAEAGRIPLLGTFFFFSNFSGVSKGGKAISGGHRAAAENVRKQREEGLAGGGKKLPVPALSLTCVPTGKQFNLF